MEAEREDVEIHLSNPSKRGPNGQIEYCSVITPNVQPAQFLPDRDITKIAETVLVSAICSVLPFCLVTPERYVTIFL